MSSYAPLSVLPHLSLAETGNLWPQVLDTHEKQTMSHSGLTAALPLLG